MAGDDSLRLFCALRLPVETVDGLVAWQHAELASGRIVERENLHVTLAFLGSRPASDVEQIAAALRAAAVGSGRIVLRPRAYRETRSVGMVVCDDEDERATGLTGRLHERLEALGVYRRETRPWLPHVTVLRFREPPGLRPPLPELGPIVPSDAAVYLSRLRSGGAQYAVLEEIALGG